MLSGRIVRHMLFHNHEKPGVPVPRAKLSDLVTHDNKNHKHAKKLLQLVLPEAQVSACACASAGRGCLEVQLRVCG